MVEQRLNVASALANRQSSRQIAGQCFAAGTILITLFSGWLPIPRISEEGYLLFGLMGLLIVRDGDVTGLGLVLSPERGWWHWCRLGAWIGLAVGIASLAYVGAVYFTDRTIPVPRIEPQNQVFFFFWMCVEAPLIEELLFRSLLTVAVQPTLGDRGTIIASGLLFAAVHFRSGVASPENQIAGFLLAWAFLRSGTILVPLLWHSAGNCVAFSAQMASWYLLPEQWP